MEGKKILSGFWDENDKIGLFGKKENKREGKRGSIKKLVGPSIFYPSDVGRKSEWNFFSTQLRV